MAINNQPISSSVLNPFGNGVDDPFEFTEQIEPKDSKVVEEIKNIIEDLSSKIGFHFSFHRERDIINLDKFSSSIEDDQPVAQNNKQKIEKEKHIEFEALENILLQPEEVIIDNGIVLEVEPKEEIIEEAKNFKWEKIAVPTGIALTLVVMFGLVICYLSSSGPSDALNFEENTCPAVNYENSSEATSPNVLTNLSTNLFSKMVDVASNISSELSEVVSNTGSEIIKYVNSSIFDEKPTNNFSADVLQENSIYSNNNTTIGFYYEKNENINDSITDPLEQTINNVAENSFGFFNYIKDAFKSRFVSDLTKANSISL